LALGLGATVAGAPPVAMGPVTWESRVGSDRMLVRLCMWTVSHVA
jgi:hypothetical protein